MYKTEIEEDIAIREVVLGIGQMHVTSSSEIITCYGLGSCIGLFIQDRLNHISGGAHIALPGQNLGKINPLEPAMYLDNAFFGLISLMEELGADSKYLRAKLVGGADLFQSKDSSVGAKNGNQILKLLRDNAIYIAGSAIGGCDGRSCKFNTDDGKLWIHNAKQNTEFYL